MSEKVSSIIYSLFTALTLFFTGCTHSPTNPNNSSNEVLTGIATDDALTPDFIVPPINVPVIESSSIKFTSNEQLIWQHIAKNLALSQFYEHPRVVQQKQKYLNNADYLSIVTRQAEPFIHFILSEIEQRQMPAELAILPIVESSYFPKARSRAKAVGLWQFMSHTAKEFGLQQTYGYDGRHDVYASTAAALDYLAYLYNQFDANWLLALAAYNAGPQRVKRALKTNTANNNEENYWDLQLPRETRDYIPKILALSAIVSDKQLSSTLLHPIADEPHIETIEVNKRISTSKLIQTSGINATELCMLNPALRNLNYLIPEGYCLLVPKHDAELLSMIIDSMPEETLPAWQKHIVAKGESLSSIAKRYSTSVAMIREANNLNGNTIVAGHSLRVPPVKNNSKKITTRHAVTEQVSASKPSNIEAPYFYVIAMGDSFWKIANRNNTTVDRLAIINGRNPNQPLIPGESILID